MPPRPTPETRAARHRLDLRRDGGDFGNMRGVGVARRDRRCKARPHRTAGSACRLPSWRRRARASRSLSPKRISAVATVSFSLITGTAPSSSKRLQRGAGVEIAAALFGVAKRQQDLRRDNVRRPPGCRHRPRPDAPVPPPPRPGFLPAAARRVSASAARRPSAMAPDETRMHFRALASQRGDVGAQRYQPVAAQRAACAIDQQRRADLDHDQFGGGKTARSWRPCLFRRL